MSVNLAVGRVKVKKKFDSNFLTVQKSNRAIRFYFSFYAKKVFFSPPRLLRYVIAKNMEILIRSQLDDTEYALLRVLALANDGKLFFNRSNLLRKSFVLIFRPRSYFIL